MMLKEGWHENPHWRVKDRALGRHAVIGIFGQAPIELKLVDPSKPPVREV